MNIVFITTCTAPWGGSEELWGGTAEILVSQGHRVSAFLTVLDCGHPQIVRLREAGVEVRFLASDWLRYADRFFSRCSSIFVRPIDLVLSARLKAQFPEFVVVSQGGNFDGVRYGEICRRNGIPYVMLSQKASDAGWPNDSVRPLMKSAYLGAVRSFFVSLHNLNLTELQMGARLPNAEVVSNPCAIAGATMLPWPDSAEEIFNLACVARLMVKDKGQDILLQVLSRPKWRERNIRVSFYGDGINREGLIEMGRMLGLDQQVAFRGFAVDAGEIWKAHHALVLPSRCEGLPLSAIEAMTCGRPSIVTAAGGTADIVEDNVTGFVARGADTDALDEAMERGWSRREEWQAMGRAAARRIRVLLPADPHAVFVEKILGACGKDYPREL